MDGIERGFCPNFEMRSTPSSVSTTKTQRLAIPSYFSEQHGYSGNLRQVATEPERYFSTYFSAYFGHNIVIRPRPRAAGRGRGRVLNLEAAAAAAAAAI